MLETLHIQNYALIDDLEVELGTGFNVLTGETGAGKSIIVGALNLVLGARASTDSLRDPARPARVDAVFRLEKTPRRLKLLLEMQGIVPEDGTLILSRVITQEGRTRAYACGSPVPVSVLSDIGDELVDLHGQHEHQSLLRPERQLDLLDTFAENEELVDQIAVCVTELHSLSKTVTELEADDRERTRRVDFLRHEVAEIDAAALENGEEETLRTRRNLITNAERLFSSATHARATLYDGEDGSVISLIDQATHDLTDLTAIDVQFRSLDERLANARFLIEEISEELRQYSERMEFDPEELERLNQRINLIQDLKRKYGSSVEAILEYRNHSSAEIAAFDERDQRLVETRARYRAQLDQAQKKADQLSQKRKSAARKLDKAVSTVVQDLGMKGGRFETAFTFTELSVRGIDTVEFLLAANPGEKLKPLRSVASGGEISRIMLAIKAVFANADKIPTLVFDEIDAGVGGHIARNVAAKIDDLAQSHQILCITHLAQIAALAQNHYCVTKETQKTHTISSVVKLSDEKRIEEIARLLDGSVSDVSVKHATVMLRDVSIAKKQVK